MKKKLKTEVGRRLCLTRLLLWSSEVVIVLLRWGTEMELFAQAVASIALIMLLIIITQTEASGQVRRRDEPPHPLSKVALHRSRELLDSSVTISASPDLLGQNGQTAAYVTVSFKKQKGAAETDWIGVFSPAKFKYFPSPSPCQVLSIVNVRKS
jgi:hypothetical protein